MFRLNTRFGLPKVAIADENSLVRFQTVIGKGAHLGFPRSTRGGPYKKLLLREEFFVTKSLLQKFHDLRYNTYYLWKQRHQRLGFMGVLVQ